MPLVLESCAKYGEEENFLVLAYARDFAQSEISIHTVLERLTRAADVHTVWHYNAIVCEADLELLRPLLPEVRKTKNVLPETVKRIERRLMLAATTTEQLWEQLFAYCEEIAPRRLDQVDFDYGVDLVEALARKPDLPAEELKSCLQDEETYKRYNELFLVILAGEARIGKVIPQLIGKLRIHTDLLCQYASDSLVKIGTEEVIAGLKKCFLGESDHFRIFASRVLGHIKIPASEDALLEIFPEEEDPDIKTFLALGLCDLVSEKGVPLVKQLIEEEDYEQRIVELRRPLYAACRILGIELEEVEQWRRELEEEELETRRHMETWDVLGGMALPSAGPQQQGRKKKIGRNEPCPRCR
jgi:hypothetical protein